MNLRPAFAVRQTSSVAGHSVESWRVIPANESPAIYWIHNIKHLAMCRPGPCALDAPPVTLRAYGQRASLRKRSGSAAYFSTGYQQRPASGHISGLHNHFVELVGALAVDYPLQRARLDIPDAICGLYRQRLHQLDLPVNDILSHCANGSIAYYVA